MNRFSLSKFVGISVLSLSIGILPLLPASAQTNTDPGNNMNAPGERAAGESADRDFDWGWLGLLGLLGLAGLKGGKKQETTTQYREPNTAGTRSSF